MKSLKKILPFLLLLATLSGVAQTSQKFAAGMKKGLEQLGAAAASADFMQASNYFERIAQAEPSQWLPAYYASYSSLVAGLTNNDKALKDQYFDRALKKVEEADAISKNNSEIYLLKGYIQFMKMSVDPQARLDLMGQAAATIETARTMNPENPRVYLIRGQNTFYMPEAFGGGKAKAKPLLEMAVAKFKAVAATGALEPSWGAGQASSLLEKCQ